MEVTQKNEELRTVNWIEIPDWLIKNVCPHIVKCFVQFNWEFNALSCLYLQGNYIQ